MSENQREKVFPPTIFFVALFALVVALVFVELGGKPNAAANEAEPQSLPQRFEVQMEMPVYGVEVITVKDSRTGKEFITLSCHKTGVVVLDVRNGVPKH